MAYAVDRDKVLNAVGSIPTAKGSIAVRIVSYDGGEAKIAIVRTREGEEGEQQGKLGRLTADEAQGLAPLLTAASIDLHNLNYLAAQADKEKA